MVDIKEAIKGVSEFVGKAVDTIAPDEEQAAIDFGMKVFGTPKELPSETTKPEVRERTELEREMLPEDRPLTQAPTTLPDFAQDILTQEPAGKIKALEDTEFDELGEEDEVDVDAEEVEMFELLAGLKQMQRRIQGKEGYAVSKVGAVKKYHEELKSWENPNETGFQNNKFMPIRSFEGRGSDKGNSEYEIGYGIKIRQSWISDDRKDWPKINGIPTDIRDGISRKQAEEWSYELQGNAFKTAKSQIKEDLWPKLAETEKTFWTDLIYNGGPGAIKANTQAKKALDAGFSVEAMLKCMNFINADGKPLRGLLNRRISRYNSAALDLSGVPVIEKYEIKDGTVDLFFASNFSTNKVSKGYLKGLADKKMTLNVKPGMKVGVYESDRQYNFRK